MLIGRDTELNSLKEFLEKTKKGNGSTVIISGEPGIGKTRLLEEFRKHTESAGVRVLSGAAMSGSAHPFQIFSKALEGITEEPLFEESEYTSFTEIFAVNIAGLLLGKASSKDGSLDADIFAGMLSAVQDFVRDSFDHSGENKAGLGRLEYGDMKILIEHGQHLFLTAVFSGNEHPDMKKCLQQTLRKIEEKHGHLIETWTGKMADIAPVQEDISKLAESRFLVRKNMEGVKLENERIRIADEVLETLKFSSTEKPMVIFLEDLHWADESSLFVLNYLARNIRKAPILLLGTLRPGESEILQKTLENMKSEETLDEILLEKLDVENTVSLINKIYSPNDFPDTLAERLYEQSKGNPLFVTEMLRGMYHDGSIAEKDGKYLLVSESYNIPATVEEVVNHRLETLDPNSMAMVEYVSCIGQRFDTSLAASNRLMKDSDESLEKLLASGILLRKNGTLEFSHAVFQSVIYSGIGERWKTGHHRSIGEYLEMTYPDRLDEVIYDLARHFSKTKEYRKISDYCIKAGEKSENSFAMEQALVFYSEALAALSKLDTTHVRDRISFILERTGDIRTIMGNYDEAIVNFRKAEETIDGKMFKARMLRKVGEVYEKKGDYDKMMEYLERAKKNIGTEKTSEYGRVLKAEGMVHFKKGDYQNGLSLFQRALRLFEDMDGGCRDTGETLRVIGNVYTDTGEYESALQHYEKSLKIMEDLKEMQGIAAALADIGGIHRHRGDDSKAMEYHERSLGIRKTLGDKQGIARSLNNIGIMHWQKGELDKALESFKRSLEMLEKMGDKQRVAVSLNNIGGVYQNKGEMEMALEFYGRSLGIKEKIGDKPGVASSLSSIGGVQHTLGALDKALELLGRSLDIREEIGDKTGIALSLNNIGEVYHYKRQPERALDFLERSLELCLDIGERWLSVHNHCVLAEVYIALGNIQEAMHHAENALGVSIEIDAKLEEGMSRRVLVTVWREMKEWEKARKEFELAQKILEEIENKEELAKLSYECALLYMVKGDKNNAEEQLDRTLSEFERMGMRLWAGKCHKALEELQ